MKRSPTRCSTCCLSAPAIRRGRSWRKLFSTAPDKGISRLLGGSQPKGRVHPYALDLLRQLHYDVSNVRSKSWTEFAGPNAPKLDFAFTLCDDAAAEPCPVWPGQPMTAHWGMPDPATKTGTVAEMRYAFADTMRMLTNRINIFISLPMKSLDALTLQKQLDAIGKNQDRAPDTPKVAE